MLYNNIFTLLDSLSNKLYKFNGHSVDANHTSTMFDSIARGCDYLKNTPSAKSLNYDASIYVNGASVPVIVTIAGSDIHSEMDCIIQINHEEN